MLFKYIHCIYNCKSWMTADEILEVLLNPDDYDTCAGMPQYVQEPAAFLIDSNVLKDKKDIRADGNGVWSCRNKPKRYLVTDLRKMEKCI